MIERLEQLGALPGNSIAKFRAILEVSKTASQDEVAMRTQLLKEKQCGGDERAEREEIQRRFREIVRELA